MRTVRRSFMTNRIRWGSVIDSSPRGPIFSDAAPEVIGFYTAGDPITVSMWWTVDIPVRFTGCRIYKAPNATGVDIPIRLWSQTGAITGSRLASTTVGTWTVDAGGWRQVDVPRPDRSDAGHHLRPRLLVGRTDLRLYAVGVARPGHRRLAAHQPVSGRDDRW